MTLNSNGFFAERVTDVQHYTDRLFRFRVTRPQSLRFRSGEFVMLGLPSEGKPLLRAYSIASPSWDEGLEFFSIKVPGGPLTEKLQNIKPGDEILLRPKTTGTLVHDALLPGKRLFMISTGTGIAPFVSIMRDPETYERFETVVVSHTCRTRAELQYGFDSVAATKDDPLVGEEAQKRLLHFASTTREESTHQGRITKLIESGEFCRSLGLPQLNPAEDRIMLCGSMAMIKDVKALLEPQGFSEGANSEPGSIVVERAFVG
ncbi:MAG: ferredoxin--NADP reductase [Alphaproteobacteria bacterium]|nr:ferredoxin--NADP reductase [Alphaproteobacteria bacterium]